MYFRYWMFYSFSSLLASILCFITVIVALMNADLKVNRRFAFMSITFCIWTLLPFLGGAVSDHNSALFWIRTLYIMAAFAPATILHFIFSLLEIDNKKLIRMSYVISILFLVFIYSDLFIVDFVTKAPNTYIIPGPLYLLYMLFFSSVCVYSVFLLLKRYSSYHGYKKEQLKFIFVSFIVVSIAGVLHIGAAYAPIEIIPHDVFVCLWTLIVFYSVWQYGYLDLKKAFIKTIINIAFFTICIGIPFYLGFVYEQWFICSVLIVFLSSFSIILLKFLKLKTRHILFGKQDNYHKILLKIFYEFFKQKDLVYLSKLFVRTLMFSVRPDFVSLFLYKQETDNYVLYAGGGKAKSTKEFFEKDSEVVSYINQQVKPFLCTGSDVEIKSIFSNVVGQESVYLIIPILEKSNDSKNLLGFCVLGDKKNGALYSIEDLKVFEMLSVQISLALMSCQYIEKLKQQQRILFESEKLASIGGMVDGLSHQIRNRLNNFALVSELLEYDLESLKNKHGRFIKENTTLNDIVSGIQKLIISINENVEKTSSLLKTVLTFSSQTKTSKKFENFYLKELVTSSIYLVCMKHKKTSIPVIVDIDETDVIYGIQQQIQEVCFNCIDNAYEAVVEKMEHIKKSIFNDIDKDVNYVPLIKVYLNYLIDKKQIIIEDNGIGIKQINKQKIFSAFFTTKPSSKTVSGIGSYLAKKIICENHKGDMTFESEYGKGSKFIITLPVSKNSKV